MSAHQPQPDKSDDNADDPKPPPPTYDHKNYRFTLLLLPDGRKDEEEQKSKWCVELKLWCHDLPKLMREGVWWSSANIVPNRGYFDTANPRDTKLRYTRVRHWVLSEDPKKEESQVQWHGTIKLLARDYNVLAGFSLGQLSRDNIYKCLCWNREGEWIFCCEPNRPTPAINCVYEEMHPGISSWWIWPMDRLETPPQDSDNVDEADGGSSGYANKPEDGRASRAEQENSSLSSLSRDIWRSIYGNKKRWFFFGFSILNFFFGFLTSRRLPKNIFP